MGSTYTELFNRYTRYHTGRQSIGNGLIDLLKNNETKSIAVDIGAGNGDITCYLADLFYRVDAIERREDLANSISNKKKDNINVIVSDIFDYSIDTKYDLVLMSYLLDSFDDLISINQLMSIVKKLITSDGIILGVTYLPDCAWNEFSAIVCSELSIRQKGGITNVSELLTAANCQCHILKTIESYIWGNSIDDLFLNLSFFYKSNINGYINNKDRFVALLEKNICTSNGLFELNVKEAIFDIKYTNK